MNVFVIEPIRYWVCGVASRFASTSASPSACSQITSPSRKTAALTDGSRSSAWAAASLPSRSSRSRSGADTGSERLRDRVDRNLDRVVVDAGVRNGAQEPGP